MLNRMKRWLRPKDEPQSVSSAAERFIYVFEAHGIPVSQIPRLIPQLKLSQLRTSQTLLEVLTPSIIDQVAKLFGVRSEWLEGADDVIYQTRYCYKSPELFFEHFQTINPNAENCPVRVLVNDKNLDYKSGKYQILALVLVETIQLFGEDFINRYHIYSDAWDWGYKTTRIQLKAMARLLGRIHQIPLFNVSTDTLEAVLQGERIPHEFLQRPLLSEPCLDDFSASPEYSLQAKDLEELPEVLQYIEDYKLNGFAPAYDDYRRLLDAMWHSQYQETPNSIHTASNKSRKAAISKNASGNQIKQVFLSGCEARLKDKDFNATNAARNFYDGLIESEAIKLFRSAKDFQKLTADEARENAVRTLMTAIRKHKQQKI